MYQVAGADHVKHCNDDLEEMSEVLENQEQNPLPMIKRFIESGEGLSKIVELHPSEISPHLHDFEVVALLKAFGAFEVEFAAKILVECDEATSRNLLAACSKERLYGWLKTLPADEAVDLLVLLKEDLREEVIGLFDTDEKNEIMDLLQYREDDVGSVMQAEVLSVIEGSSVAEATNSIREYVKKEDVDDFIKAFVVDAGERLKGEIPLTKLLISDPAMSINEITESVSVSVQPRMNSEEVANLAIQYNEQSMPVTDSEGKLIGRVTLDDLGEVLQEEHAEDLALMAGTGEEEPLKHRTLDAVRERLPWLFIALIGGLGSAYLMGFFEGEISGNTTLAFFIPLIAGMGGSVGIQSSSIIVRALAKGESIEIDFYLRLFRELKVSIFNGMACALAVTIFCTLFFTLGFGVFVSLCLHVIMVFAALSGTLIPILLKKSGIEPAYSTGPFITIGNDLVGIAIYLFMIRELSSFFL